MTTRRDMTRRDFVRTSAAGVAAAGVLAPSTVLGANDRIRMGVIGVGGQGTGHVGGLVKRGQTDNIQVVAVCDVYQRRINRAQSICKGEGYSDYRKLLEEFRKHGRLIRATYYTAVMEDQDFSPIRPLVDWLDYNGFSVVTKPTREFTDAQGRRSIKGNMDIEIAVDVMEIAPHVDHILLFSGDGDFRRLVEAVQRQGKRVSVISSVRTQPPMAADELRRQADQFIDLVDFTQMIARDPSARPQVPRQAPDAPYPDEDDDL